MKLLQNKEGKCAFCSAMAVGLFAHIYIFLNMVTFNDGITLIFSVGHTYSLGRWFLGFLSEVITLLFGGTYGIPWLNGVTSLLFLSFGAVILVEILEINNKVLIFLISALLVVFPTVTETFAYMFTAPYYFLALLLCLSATLVIKRKIAGWIFSGALLIGFSMGLYQSYVSVTITLLLFLLVEEFIDDASIKNIFVLAVKYAGTLFLGLTVYLVGCKISLHITGEALSEYQGVGEIGNISLAKIMNAIHAAYINFFNFFRFDYKGINNSWYIKLIYINIVILGIVGVLSRVKRNDSIKNKMIIGGMSIILFPIAFFFPYIMCYGEKSHVHVLMVYAIVLIPILSIAWVEKSNSSAKFRIFMLRSVQGCVIILVGYYIVLTNEAYMKVELVQNQVTSYCNSFISRVVTTENYHDEYPIIFVQNEEREKPYEIIDKSIYSLDEMFPDVLLDSHGQDMYDWISDRSFLNYFEYRMGFNIDNIYSIEEAMTMGIDCDETKWSEMPCYPDDGSIQVIDEVIYVKFSEYVNELKLW